MSDLSRLTKLCEEYRDAQEAVSLAELALKDAKALERRLSEEEIPDLMLEIGLSELQLADGNRIQVVEDVNVHISRERMPAAVAWLFEHGFGGIVKSQLTVECENREEAIRTAEQLSVPTSLSDKIHPSTLKAFVREQIAAGTDMPLDLFGVRPYNKTKLSKRRGL